MKNLETLVLLGALAGAACLYSCNSGEDIGADNGGRQVRFTADIGRQGVATPQYAPPSRAAGSQWAAGDAIGIFMTLHGTTTVAAGAANRQFVTAAGDDSFSPASAGEAIYYPMDDAAVNFVAYYPYTDGVTFDNKFPCTVSGTQTAATQADMDVLWAKADNGGTGYKKSAGNEPVALGFSHVLSKLTMKCKADASVGPLNPADVNVAVRDVKCNVLIDLRTGTPDAPTAPGRIVPRKLDGAPADFFAVYDAIIPPGAYAAGAVKVDFTVGQDTFTWDVEDITFKSGKEYIYDVTLTRTGVKVTGTIKPWIPENRDPGTAD